MCKVLTLLIPLLWIDTFLIKGVTSSWDDSVTSPWDDYVDDILDLCNDYGNLDLCDKACIIGLDGGELWNSEDHANVLHLEGLEGANISKAFKTKDFNSIRMGGLFIEGHKYIVMSKDNGKRIFGMSGRFGKVTLRATNMAVLILHGKRGSNYKSLNQAVEKIAAVFENSGI